VLSASGEVWAGDETARREFPPLRAAWAKRGEQAVVVISGRNGRRVMHGMLNGRTGEVVSVVRERMRGEDVAVAMRVFGTHRPGVPKLLIWDNAPPHHTHRVRQAAVDAGIELAWRAFRAPELNPCEDLWRRLKAVVAANRASASVDDLAARAAAWLTDLTASDVLRLAGVRSSKFDWLPT
jgi:transposase